jgi:uncharacterized protein (TIGR00296 family)
MDKENLTLEEGEVLIRTARLAIATYLQSRKLIHPPEQTTEKLRRKSGVFVTLNTVKPTHGLRGCIGFPYPQGPLIDSTIRAAIYAPKTRDSRQSPRTSSRNLLPLR